AVLFAGRRDTGRVRSSARPRRGCAKEDRGRGNHGVLMLSKRRFVQLAGLSIANRILPSGPRAQGLKRAGRVIIVTFGGGVRYSETFAPEGLRNIPRLVERRTGGHFFHPCV